MDIIKTIPWRSVAELAAAVSGANLGAHKDLGGRGWIIYVERDYETAKKGAILFYTVYGGFVTRVRRGFSDKMPLIHDKSVPLWVFTPKKEGTQRGA